MNPKVEQPDCVTVELNGETLDHDSFPSVVAGGGDAVELLYFDGGGC